MATIDQQFVEYIVKTLVNNPDKVSVDRKIDEKGVLLSLTVDPEDVGRVIGKRGVTAQSIRMLLRALGTKQDARYNLKIVNTDEDGEEHESRRSEKKVETKPEVDSDPDTSVDEEIDTDEDEDEDPEVDEEVDESEENEVSDTSELAEKTRAELADLDDLDI